MLDYFRKRRILVRVVGWGASCMIVVVCCMHRAAAGLMYHLHPQSRNKRVTAVAPSVKHRSQTFVLCSMCVFQKTCTMWNLLPKLGKTVVRWEIGLKIGARSNFLGRAVIYPQPALQRWPQSVQSISTFCKQSLTVVKFTLDDFLYFLEEQWQEKLSGPLISKLIMVMFRTVCLSNKENALVIIVYPQLRLFSLSTHGPLSDQFWLKLYCDTGINKIQI